MDKGQKEKLKKFFGDGPIRRKKNESFKGNLAEDSQPLKRRCRGAKPCQLRRGEELKSRQWSGEPSVRGGFHASSSSSEPDVTDHIKLIREPTCISERPSSQFA